MLNTKWLLAWNSVHAIQRICPQLIIGWNQKSGEVLEHSCEFIVRHYPNPYLWEVGVNDNGAAFAGHFWDVRITQVSQTVAQGLPTPLYSIIAIVGINNNAHCFYVASLYNFVL